MNLYDLKHIIDHLKKESRCLQCKKAFLTEDIHVVATTTFEGLFELKCSSCGAMSLATVLTEGGTPGEKAKKESLDTKVNKINELEQVKSVRQHRIISKDDILDVKNFLNNFDGNFKKLFSEDK